MKKLDFKSLAVGFVLGTVGITTVFAANGIQSATLSQAKVTLNGAPVPLTQELVAVRKDGEKEANLYMPLRELLTYLDYDVKWDEKTSTVDLRTMKPVVSSYSDKFEGGVAANNKQFGNPFPAKKGDIAKFSLASELSGRGLDKDAITLKIVIGGNDGTTQEIVLSNKEPVKEIVIKENANHHVTIHNPNNQLVNYSIVLTLTSPTP